MSFRRRDPLWTGPIVAGALLLMVGMLVGSWATEKNAAAKLDAYMDGRLVGAHEQALQACWAESEKEFAFEVDPFAPIRELGP